MFSLPEMALSSTQGWYAWCRPFRERCTRLRSELSLALPAWSIGSRRRGGSKGAWHIPSKRVLDVPSGKCLGWRIYLSTSFSIRFRRQVWIFVVSCLEQPSPCGLSQAACATAVTCYSRALPLLLFALSLIAPYYRFGNHLPTLALIEPG